MLANRRHDEAINGVRLRGKGKDVDEDGVLDEGLPGAGDVTSASKRRANSTTLPASVVSVTLLLYVSLFSLQLYMENYQLPQPLLLSDAAAHPEHFIAERAMTRLLKLTALGPRVSASHANEVLAVEILKSEVESIMKIAHPSKRVELDVQRASGAYPLEFLDGLTNWYRGVPNVVVRLSSQTNPSWPHSLLLNCHFDSVPDSPGGSDDGASCANMLEILHVLAASPRPLTHNVIFLFNGAEENLMHASHGFITQHRWASQVRAFVNLEACGAGGREVLFQSGPNSPWIMETYANTVPRPFASSMAQEIFESGIVPGDTDFRVFRDFGNVSGLDFAWSTNGYVYHTRFDDAAQIPLGTLQRTGDNVLALVRGLTSAHQLADPALHRPGNLVYFDVLGLVVVRWSETVANVLNVTTVGLALLAVALNRRAFHSKGSQVGYLRELGKALAIVLLGTVLCTAVSVTIAGFVTAIGRNMSWYARPTWLLFLYVIPCITTVMAVQLYAARWQLKTVGSKRLVVQIYQDVYLLIWTAALVLGIVLQVRSACLPWLWVISPVLAALAQRFLRHHDREPGMGWLLVFLLGMVGPVLQFSGMQVGILSLFIPILGRVGSSLNPDLVVGLYCTHTFAMLFSYASPLVLLEKRPGLVLRLLTGVSVLSLLLLSSSSSLSFPYSADPVAPRPQRYMFVHTERAYYNYSRLETGRQSGYWIIDMDYNSPHAVQPYVPEVRGAEEVQDCEQDQNLYCGLPYLMPALSLVKKTHWIPGPSPTMGVPQHLKLTGKEYYPGNRTMRLTFRATGPDHMGLMLSVRPQASFQGWSLGPWRPVRGPKWQDRDTYFVYLANAVDKEPWVFYIDVLPKYLKQPMVDIALTGHHLHGPHQRSPAFQNVVDQFPPWTAVTAWTASYKSYVF